MVGTGGGINSGCDGTRVRVCEGAGVSGSGGSVRGRVERRRRDRAVGDYGQELTTWDIT